MSLLVRKGLDADPETENELDENDLDENKLVEKDGDESSACGGGGGPRFTKRNNSIMAIDTKRLKILDITNYLSPGTSYSAYLKAFHVTEKKGYFPYEYITNFDQLYETKLPPYEKFYSNLNGKNPLDEGESPDAGRKRWNELQTLWQINKMPNILALLEWYNNLDTSSFVQAAQTQCAFFRENMGIDILKEAISLPGVSLKFAMKTTDAKFCL